MLNMYYGSLCSLLYDIDKPSPPEGELNLYLSYAAEGTAVLEAMCGSGRFLCEFARQRFSIDGFDLSKDMLSRCSEKLAKEGLSARLSNCNFEGYHSDKKYGLIFIGGASFPLIIDDGEIVKALRKLHSLLEKDGRLIVSIEPDKELSEKASAIDEYEFFTDEMAEWKRVQQGHSEIILKGKSSYNAYRGVIYSYMVYELYERGMFVRDEQEDFYMKIYKDGEFERLAADCGFIIKNIYRDYDKTPYNGEGSNVIVYELTV